MTMMPDLSRRALLKAGGALVVGYSLAGARLAAAQAADSGHPIGKTVDPHEVDGFLAIHQDGALTVYSGKVDLGTGYRIAVRQMVAEELEIPVERIALVEGDTALTPDQGPTAGSSGIMRGGVQIRQAAATARQALLKLASAKMNVPVENLGVLDGAVIPKGSTIGVTFGALIGDQRFELKLDPKAPLKDPRTYAVVGQTLKRPDMAEKVTGRHVYMHDFKLANMLHGRVLHPPAVGATLAEVDEASIAKIPGARVIRIENFLGIVAEDEWSAVRAQRELKARWTGGGGLPGNDGLIDAIRRAPVIAEEAIETRGDAAGALKSAAKTLRATYFWPPQTHGSIGPSCAVAEFRDGTATIWTASQATHKYREHFATIFGLPPEKVRLIYLDGAGCYGMNGHEDAAADAALLSRATGRPVRVQWMREDEHGFDPKGPPQLLDLEAGLDQDGRIIAWASHLHIPQATKGLANIPLLSPAAAGLAQKPGIGTGLISQNGDPSYPVPHVAVTAHWLKDTPLRPSNIRAPGKIGNCFAVEGFVDELAEAAQVDALEFRLRTLEDPRAIAVLKRVGELMQWEPRVSATARSSAGSLAHGRGVAYIRYKQSENYVAMGIAVTVDRGSGTVQVTRVVCAHDCGLVINPDTTKNQIEGSIVQTLSRALFEEVTFDHDRVTSVDWASYRILKFPEVPEIVVDLLLHQELPPLGVGEAAAAPVAAPLANAVFDATGARLRTVPFTPDRVKAALARG